VIPIGANIAAIAQDKQRWQAVERPGDLVWWGLLAIVLHFAVVMYVNRVGNTDPLVQPPQIPPMTVDLVPSVPQEVVKPEPPKPRPTTPVQRREDVVALKPQLPKETPQPSPPAVAPTAAPPAPVEESITPPIGRMGYLNNPAPAYPSFAQSQGWEGKVLLKVHVLSSGRPDNIAVQKSSGRKTLDEAALNAVKGWTFVPAKRGQTPIDGWVTVPIEFKLTS
jgi:protein TonB